MDSLSPDVHQLIRLIVALALVLGLMGGLSFFLKKLGLVTIPVVKKGDARRIKLIESLPLDTRRRAVILECDAKQYFVILGPNGETVIDSEITPVDCSAKKDTASS
jgi:flagellar protein FliO/FliZ